jgi:branched-subunit amino acid transport protein
MIMMMMMIIIIIIIIMEFKTRVIPVIIGATEPISKSFRKYVSTIPRNHAVKERQKTAILGTAHILRKVLM